MYLHSPEHLIKVEFGDFFLQLFLGLDSAKQLSSFNTIQSTEIIK